MTREPVNLKASVAQRLRNIAIDKKTDYQLILLSSRSTLSAGVGPDFPSFVYELLTEHNYNTSRHLGARLGLVVSEFQ